MKRLWFKVKTLVAQRNHHQKHSLHTKGHLPLEPNPSSKTCRKNCRQRKPMSNPKCITEEPSWNEVPAMRICWWTWDVSRSASKAFLFFRPVGRETFLFFERRGDSIGNFIMACYGLSFLMIIFSVLGCRWLWAPSTLRCRPLLKPKMSIRPLGSPLARAMPICCWTLDICRRGSWRKRWRWVPVIFGTFAGISQQTL